MLQLSEIWIYPIKSLGGISLDAATVLHRGLEHDRRWMLVDEEGVFLSQRTTPKLALFNTAINGDYLQITHKSLPVTARISVYPNIISTYSPKHYKSKY